MHDNALYNKPATKRTPLEGSLLISPSLEPTCERGYLRCTPTDSAASRSSIATSMPPSQTTKVTLTANSSEEWTLGVWIHDPTTGDDYYGNDWPDSSSWTGWVLLQFQNWRTNELKTWHGNVPFNGVWIDLSDVSSFCVGSYGNGRLNDNPVHRPFLLPNDPGNAAYRFPEGFSVSNATQAAAAMSASAAQASMLSPTTLILAATTTTQGRTEPTQLSPVRD